MSQKLTLKEELELLRGEPIQVFAGDPLAIPCIETSDSERLCKHPVVSVHMITYNHEPYIRQAIEGVMMQKTNFEFELVIGEDCSTDKTREICFEYQKRFPDRIRVLWCDHNLYRNPHPAGGNIERNLARCRGELIAWCEGDDYWIDPLKLQKQVDVFSKYPNVGLCFCGADKKSADGKLLSKWTPYCGKTTILKGDDYNRVRFGWNRNPSLPRFCDDQLRTPTAMYRVRIVQQDNPLKKILSWRLCVGDYSLWSYIASGSDVCFLNENVSVYRVHAGGITSYNLLGVKRDCDIIMAFFLHSHYGVERSSLVSFLGKEWFRKVISKKNLSSQHRVWRVLTDEGTFFPPVISPSDRRRLFLLRIGLYRVWMEAICTRAKRLFPILTSG